MNGSNEIAIKVLEERRDQLIAESRAQVEELNRAIQKLRGGKVDQLNVTISHPVVRRNQWRGMTIKSALIAYLNERPGGVLTTRAAHDLARGGVDFGKKSSEPRRHVRITIGNNRKIFDYDERTDTVRLFGDKAGAMPNSQDGKSQAMLANTVLTDSSCEVRPGQWQGMSIKSALIAYLNERPGNVPVTRASTELFQAGVRMGTKRTDPRRYLRITIGNNRKVFGYDQKSDTVWLVDAEKASRAGTRTLDPAWDDNDASKATKSA